MTRHGQARRELASRWASAVETTAYLPLSRAELRQRLAELVDAMADQLATGQKPQAAADAGATLVRLHCTDWRSLRRTVEVLGNGLPELPELSGTEVITALGMLSASFADELRRRTLEQQEEVAKALEHVLRLSEARFREVFTSSVIGIAISDVDGRLVRSNRALANILGYPDGEPGVDNVFALLGQGNNDQLRHAYRELVGGLVPRFRLERSLTRRDGELVWVYLAVSALHDDEGRITHHVTMVEDITDLHLMQAQLNNQALHDVLTGLPNRQSFELRVESTLGQLDPSATVTLLHLDLDGFSMVNNSLGQQTGDWLLRLVARRLTDIFAGERAVIARIGGDEFAILVENSPTTPPAATLAAKINEELSEPAYREDIGLAASASIGVVQRPAGGIDHTELLRQSDATLRRAKRKGKRQWAIFDHRQDAADRRLFQAAAGMPGELENGNFRLDYRPFVRLASLSSPGGADGAEGVGEDRVPAGIVTVQALLHWDHPERGQLGHDDVVSFAEHTGMVLPIGDWMLNTACKQAAAWLARFGASAPPLAINLPVGQASDPDLTAAVNRALRATGLPADRLHIGLPVGALLGGESEADDNMQVLAEMGVLTSIHGFGDSHGGLVLLEDLPVLSVWMAGWLVRRIAKRPGSVAGQALGDLVPLVHNFGATVCIPEIQTEVEATWWRSAGADLAGGDLFGPASPPEEITARLAAGAAFQAG